MNHTQALQIVDQAVSSIPASRQDHSTFVQAIQKLSALVNEKVKAESPPETKAE